MLHIGIERSPKNTAFLLSTILVKSKLDLSNIGNKLIKSLTTNLNKGIEGFSRQSLPEFLKNVDIYSFVIFTLYSSPSKSQDLDLIEIDIIEKTMKKTNLAKKMLKPSDILSISSLIDKLILCTVIKTNHIQKFSDGVHSES